MSDKELAEDFANNGYALGCTKSPFEVAKEAFLAGRQSKCKHATELKKLKKYAKLLQDICTVMGNDVYMVSAGLESRVKLLWDASEEKEGLKMVEDIENRLLEIKPQDWAEIEKW